MKVGSELMEPAFGTPVPVILPFEQQHSVFTLVVVMITGGFLGSLCRQYFDKTYKDCTFLEILVPGIVAAFVVPLFLSIGRSDIIGSVIDGGKEFYLNLLIIFAFCLLASVSARSFVDALAREALNKADKAESKASSAQATAMAANDRSEETRDFLSDTIEDKADVIPHTPTKTPEQYLELAENEIERSIIKALLKKPDTKRSASSIASEEGLTKAGCLLAIIALLHRNVVKTFKSSTGSTLYKLTD